MSNVSSMLFHMNEFSAPFKKYSFIITHLHFTPKFTGISLQEAIWGTKTLTRLEAIKEAIDPDYMFDCYGCIGNNRVKSDDSNGDETTPSETPTIPNPTNETTEDASSALSSFPAGIQTLLQITLFGVLFFCPRYLLMMPHFPCIWFIL